MYEVLYCRKICSGCAVHTILVSMDHSSVSVSNLCTLVVVRGCWYAVKPELGKGYNTCEVRNV